MALRVNEALDMFLPGMFAYRSILEDGKRMQIPDLRDPSVREAWRNDTACVDPKVAGDQLLPTQKGGTPVIDDAVYARVKAKWDKANETGDDAYLQAAFSQGGDVQAAMEAVKQKNLALQAERRKHKSQWDDNEEEAHKAKMKELRNESNEAALAVGIGSREFSNVQKERIVEVDSSEADFSSMQVMNLGSGMTGAYIDLSV